MLMYSSTYALAILAGEVLLYGVHRSEGFHTAPTGFRCRDCDAAAMTAEDTTEAAVSRRDILVQQLLEERRQRLQQKLSAVPAPTSYRELQTCSFNSLQENLSPKRNVSAFIPEKEFQPVEPRDDGFLTAVLARLKAAEDTVMHSEPNPVVPFEPVKEAPAVKARPQSAPSKTRQTTKARAKATPKAQMATPSKAHPKVREPQSAKSERQGATCASRRNSSLGSFNQRLQKWQLQHQASKEKQMQAKQDKEMEELGGCTFQPSINSRSEFYARRSRGCFAQALRSDCIMKRTKGPTFETRQKKSWRLMPFTHIPSSPKSMKAAEVA